MDDKSKNTMLDFSIATRLSNKHFITLLNPNKNDSILDIGCGTGNFLSKIKNKTGKISGMDIDDSALNVAKSILNCPLILCDVGKKFPIENNLFNKAVSSMVIEHIREVNNFIFETSRILRPSGTFIISAPNKESLFCHTKLAKLGHEDASGAEYHVRDGFSEKELRDLLKKYNFNIKEIRFFMFPFSEIMMFLTKIAYFLKTKKKGMGSQSEIFEVKKSVSFKILKIIFPIFCFFSLLEEFLFYKIFNFKILHRKLGHSIIIKAVVKK